MGLGLEVGVGEGVEAVGLSGFVCCGSVGFVWVGVWLGFGGWICLGWDLAGVCFKLCFWLRRMWWLCGGGCWLLAAMWCLLIVFD